MISMNNFALACSLFLAGETSALLMQGSATGAGLQGLKTDLSKDDCEPTKVAEGFSDMDDDEKVKMTACLLKHNQFVKAVQLVPDVLCTENGKIPVASIEFQKPLLAHGIAAFNAIVNKNKGDKEFLVNDQKSDILVAELQCEDIKENEDKKCGNIALEIISEAIKLEDKYQPYVTKLGSKEVLQKDIEFFYGQNDNAKEEIKTLN